MERCKVCFRCKKTKNLSAFPKRLEGSSDGHRGICFECEGERKTLISEVLVKQETSSETKVCDRCNTEKLLRDFCKGSRSKDGRRGYCNECRNKKTPTVKRPSKIVDLEDGTRICNKCHIAKPLLTAFRSSPSSKLGKEGQCRDCVQKAMKIHIANKMVLKTEGTKVCFSCKKEKDVNDFGKCKTFLDGRQVYCLECTRKKENEWRTSHPEEIKAISKRKHQRNKTNVQAKIKNCLRQAVRRRIRQIRGDDDKAGSGVEDKAGSGVEDLGCSLEFFQTYIESLWQPGMTWANWSRWGWHVDHIQPVSSFDLTIREDLLMACHYTNLRPLWWNDNVSKGCKPPEEFTTPLSSGPALRPAERQLDIIPDDPLPEPLPDNL